MSIQLTRRGLYEMVWTRSMTKVAAELGISDVALHKICEKHRIPAPGRGHWAKVAAGNPPKRALFRDVSDPLVDRILIQGSPAAKLPPEVLEARAKVKAEREKRQTMPPLPVPSGQSDHPVLARLTKKLETAKADKDGFIRLTDPKLFAMTISPAAAARALVITERLMARADAHACRFDSDPGGLVLVADSEPMTLHLVEQTEKVRHEPTDAEVNALQKWEADRERRQRRGQWFGDWDKPAIPEWDHVPRGTLVFELDRGGGWDGLRRRFADSKRKRLEDMIDDVLGGALVIAAARKAKRAEDAPARRRTRRRHSGAVKSNGAGVCNRSGSKSSTPRWRSLPSPAGSTISSRITWPGTPTRNCRSPVSASSTGRVDTPRRFAGRPRRRRSAPSWMRTS